MPNEGGNLIGVIGVIEDPHEQLEIDATRHGIQLEGHKRGVACWCWSLSLLRRESTAHGVCKEMTLVATEVS